MPNKKNSKKTIKSLNRWTRKLNKKWEKGEIEPSSHYLLGLLFLDGKPMTLDKHFMFKPLFKFPRHNIRPKRCICKTARQVGKTTTIVAVDLLNNITFPGWTSLFVTPLFEQIKRISSEFVNGMVQETPFKDMIIDSKCKNAVFLKNYKNRSKQYFSHAYLSSDRIRSISGVDICNIDEIQHILRDHIPVILETMSAKPETAFISYTGTPLSFANPIQNLWEKSSQCEWVTKCQHCNHWNIPTTKHDLLEMIGKETVVCSRCKKPINPAKHGTWLSPVIKNPKELEECLHDGFMGLHIPQIIHPLHYMYPEQWKNLIYKMNSDDYSTARFINEVCGESYDSADRMITKEELANVCCGNPNKIKKAVTELQKFDITAMGIDWGGGGEDTVSYTKIAVGGCRPGKTSVQTVYVETIPKHWPTEQQAKRVLDIFKSFKPGIVSHDYQGMGHVYEPLLLNKGLPQHRLWPMAYVTAPHRPIIYYNEPSEGNRECLNLDRARSLSSLYNTIKSKKVIFPSWDSMKLESDPNKREVDDFMSMFGEESRVPSGGVVYRIQTDADKPDDLVHAVNFMTAALWYKRGAFPEIGTNIKTTLSDDDIRQIMPSTMEQYTV